MYIKSIKPLLFTLFTIILCGSLLVPISSAQCPPINIFTGETAGDLFGFSVARAGDVNNDGFDDIIVGAYEFNSLTGRVYIYSGLTGNAIYTIDGEAPDDNFGWSVAGAGDVNNDGFDDFVVGAQRVDTNGVDAGKVYVYSGFNGITLKTFIGEAANNFFGRSVAGVGDIDGDGLPDIAVAALGFDADGGAPAGHGKAYVYSSQSWTEIYTIDGSQAEAELGAIAGIGDVNSDSIPDLIVGEWAYNGIGTNSGRVYIYSGLDGSTILHTFDGETAGDFFGRKISSVGDVNSDGIEDLIVGAPLYLDTTGRAYVYSGLGGPPLYTFTGDLPGDWFGFSVSGGGDFDGDGVPDLIVGSMKNDALANNIGRVVLFAGQTGISFFDTLNGESADDWFGASAAWVGDVNNDGLADFAVGATMNDAGGLNAGRVYVYSITDTDGDGTADVCDACPGFDDFFDADADGVPDGCDSCPSFDNSLDIDGDCIADSIDNCPFVFNPDQKDSDEPTDDHGDACLLPSYLTPLVIVLSDTTAGAFQSTRGTSPPIDPEVNVTVVDPEGLSIGADSLGFITNSIGDSATYYQIDGNDSIVINGPKTGEYQMLVVSKAGSTTEGELFTIGIRTDGTVEVKITSIPNPESGTVDTTLYETIPYVFGDVNGDESVNIADVTFLIARIFSGGEAPPLAEAADANCDGSVNIADVTFLIARIFNGGEAPGCGTTGS